MIVLKIADEADQQLSAHVTDEDGNLRRLTIRLRYTGGPFGSINRWSMDLAVNDEPKVMGRKVVLGIDLVDVYNLDIGRIVALGSDEDDVPGRRELPTGVVKLLCFNDTELAAVAEELDRLAAL